MNNQKRYTLVRVFYKQENELGIKHIGTEKIDCKTLKESLDLWSCLNEEEKDLGSYVIDNINNKKQLIATK